MLGFTRLKCRLARMSDWYAVQQLDRHLIAFGWSKRLVKICQLQFRRDGFFVHFPYHPSERGVVARCEVEGGEPGKEVQVSYSDSGFIVSHKVKYSHPGDGMAHFYQDGKVKTMVRNKARSLLDRDGPGHVFSIEVQGLDEFRELPYDVYASGKYGRCLFELQAEEAPPSIHVVGRWHWLDDPTSVGSMRNPVRGRLPDGSVIEQIALAPPEVSPLHGGVMLVDLTLRDPLEHSSDHMLLFTGGFEANLGDPVEPSSFLMMSYPASDETDLPSADYVP